MDIKERLTALRARMSAHGLDAWLVPTDDFHSSEYVADYFKSRAWLSGFTGSAGSLLISREDAWLWTDGRYFLQAEDQLQGTGIQLMKIGEEGVPTIEQQVQDLLGEGQLLGFDGRCMTAGKGERFEKLLKGKKASISTDLDLTGEIWEDRPSLPCHPVWELDQGYTGKSRREKLSGIREEMKKFKADYHVVSSLDDIAWMLNLRGDDIACNPVFLSYLLIGPDKVLLFAQEEEFSDEADQGSVHGIYGSALLQALSEDGVELRPYDSLYEALAAIPEGARVMLDSSSVNHRIWTTLSPKVRRVDRTNPALLQKAVKNETEMENVRQAHIRDGVAVTRFMYWLKKAIQGDLSGMTEISAAEKLESFRSEQEHYLGPSFETISAYGPHGAIVHYEPTAETDLPLEKKSFLLVDSGGQYLEGTTDITRTFAMGPLCAEEKEAYTRVLRGNLNLAAVKFHYGCTGMAFDYIARAPLWEVGMDYNHGTGHGVGYFLNVHEAPNSFSYKNMQGRRTPCVFEEGMVTSDEPGLYLTGKFGVRCENLILCRKSFKNEYGQFMEFEALTMVPWDLDAVDVSLLTDQERKLLNDYHRTVYEKIAPHLSEEEQAWLKEATREV